MSIVMVAEEAGLGTVAREWLLPLPADKHTVIQSFCK